MLRYDDQVVLITGAGRGIGRQHALFLAARGASIASWDRVMAEGGYAVPANSDRSGAHLSAALAAANPEFAAALAAAKRDRNRPSAGPAA